jgi:hypothetical protein
VGPSATLDASLPLLGIEPQFLGSPPNELPQLPTLVRLKASQSVAVSKVKTPFLIGNMGYIWRTNADAMEMT